MLDMGIVQHGPSKRSHQLFGVGGEVAEYLIRTPATKQLDESQRNVGLEQRLSSSVAECSHRVIAWLIDRNACETQLFDDHAGR